MIAAKKKAKIFSDNVRAANSSCRTKTEARELKVLNAQLKGRCNNTAVMTQLRKEEARLKKLAAAHKTKAKKAQKFRNLEMAIVAQGLEDIGLSPSSSSFVIIKKERSPVHSIPDVGVETDECSDSEDGTDSNSDDDHYNNNNGAVGPPRSLPSPAPASAPVPIPESSPTPPAPPAPPPLVKVVEVKLLASDAPIETFSDGVFKPLFDVSRVKQVKQVARANTSFSQPTISNHLKSLKNDRSPKSATKKKTATAIATSTTKTTTATATSNPNPNPNPKPKPHPNPLKIYINLKKLN